jgi:surfactin synthase thioesterase subunit
MMVKLICIPFAGGNAHSYRKLGSSFDFVTVSTFELPGHGRRFPEPLLVDLDAMVADLLGQIRPHLASPYAFYGHSLGALLVYLLTKRILREGELVPRSLFVSGRRGPAYVEPERRHLLPKPLFLEMVRKLGGTQTEVLAEPELEELLEPVLRADFTAVADFRYEETEPFDVPILVMTGEDDEVSDEAALLWQRETTRQIRLARFTGGHFFIDRHWDEIRRLVIDCLSSDHDPGESPGARLGPMSHADPEEAS